MDVLMSADVQMVVVVMMAVAVIVIVAQAWNVG